MDVKYINPFIEASKKILGELVASQPCIGKLALMENKIDGKDVAVIIGLTGQIRGQIMFTMSDATALNIARKMIFDENHPALDDYAQSAISEMSNMILGSTSTIMYSQNIIIDITPPSICRGAGIIITSRNKFISIPLDIPNIGSININISFDENN